MMLKRQLIVYTLWRHPQIVPLLHTPDFVLQKLRGGAPLMIPGIQRGPPFPAKAKKDALVAIASLEQPSVPMVVGICEIDVASLQQVQGAKGHAVRGEHWDGDEIWAWSSGGKAGGSAPEKIDGWDVDDNDAMLHKGFEQLDVDDHEDEGKDGGVALNIDADEKLRSEPHNEYVEGEGAEAFERIEEKELSTKGTTKLTCPLNCEAAYLVQKSTIYFGKPSCTPFSTTETPTSLIHTMV